MRAVKLADLRAAGERELEQVEIGSTPQGSREESDRSVGGGGRRLRQGGEANGRP